MSNIPDRWIKIIQEKERTEAERMTACLLRAMVRNRLHLDPVKQIVYWDLFENMGLEVQC